MFYGHSHRLPKSRRAVHYKHCEGEYFYCLILKYFKLMEGYGL
jgi:hypothetical protein